MAAGFEFGQRVEFVAEDAARILRAIPALPGVFALRGEREPGKPEPEPYLTRAADLRRRVTRLLAPPETPADGRPQSKRLNLRTRVRSIEYSVTGSEFESLLALYGATSALFGPEQARRRLRLTTPFFVRLTLDHAYPRLYSTNRLTRRGLATSYGPFVSRAAAERYVDGVLDLFQLRRCWEELEVSPEHPGCAYGEMKRCMRPCNLGCTAEQYTAEAHAVEAFLGTRGESMLAGIATERDRASTGMEFESAAALHERYGKVKAIVALADELVRPVGELRGIIVQPAAAPPDQAAAEDASAASPAATAKITEADKQEAAVFLFERGCLAGPARLSTLGVRAVKEQTSVGSSLFAQPLMLEAVPLDGGMVSEVDSPELRARRVLDGLQAKAVGEPDLPTLSDHLALLRRWYYRPEKQRTGELFLPNPDGTWPMRRILRGAARMALGDPKLMAETQRDQVTSARVKILHEGREGVERVVPVVEKRQRRRQSASSSEATSPEATYSDATPPDATSPEAATPKATSHE